ncbi:Anaphase-promoting complex subunit 10 [Mortierella sp. AD031]|nr:Anaphase-promoting complex subunit 10 [Mortierella sp. AD031]KAG0209841.1 Anaphase-promoting complex subunit 10 [Mortierella sp. NVP41]
MSRELDSSDMVEIGRQATWSVSSAKTGHGIELLRDNDLDTYWQSDGPAPHVVNMQFEKKTSIRQVSFFRDKQDESYTPLRVSIRGGTNHHDLKELYSLDVEEATGWVNVNLAELSGSGRPPRVFLLQLAVLSNHHSGRDTHIRQLKLFSTRESLMSLDEELPFTAQECLQFSTIR